MSRSTLSPIVAYGSVSFSGAYHCVDHGSESDPTRDGVLVARGRFDLCNRVEDAFSHLLDDFLGARKSLNVDGLAQCT